MLPVSSVQNFGELLPSDVDQPEDHQRMEELHLVVDAPNEDVVQVHPIRAA
jgi:hypothetical protein